jgi:hypothetical protein
MPSQRFSVRFFDTASIGQAVDTDIRVDLFEEDNASIKEARVLGTDEETSIVQSSDGLGVFYTTVVDVTGYKRGEITAMWYANLGGNPTTPFPFVDTKCYPAGTALTAPNLHTWIRRQLGEPLVVVELNDEHIQDAIDDALEDFDNFITLMDSFALDVLPGVTRYGPFDTDVAGEGVVHVQFSDRFRNPHVHEPFFGISYLNELRGDFKTFAIANSFREMLERQSSEEPEWMWDPMTRFLMIHSPNTQYRGRVMYKRTYTTQTIPQEWKQKFRRLALAYSKIVLARVRGKFDAIPAPGGAASTLDHNQLLDEAHTYIDKLHDDLNKVGVARTPILWDRP